ncbi:MAG: NADH-quinone oxidoreductase subunit K [Spirochaetes bacterium]|nr:NADH-quinone oxidoreductase subunit K [Spirochaetota bacterium]
MNIDRIMEMACIIVFFVGFYGLIASNNAIKSIASITVMELAVIMFFLTFGFFPGIRPPIGRYIAYSPYAVADPLPQALMITAIIIGIAITAINLTMLITLVRQYKSADWEIIRKKSRE